MMQAPEALPIWPQIMGRNVTDPEYVQVDEFYNTFLRAGAHLRVVKSLVS